MRNTYAISGRGGLGSIFHTMVSLAKFSYMSTGILSWMLLFSYCQYAADARQIASVNGESGNQLARDPTLAARPVELASGISEVQVPIGKLFNFTVPADAFDGDILDIKVAQVDHPNLPNWLTFDPQTRLFTGLPFQTKDLGVHYIAVVALGARETSAKDVFSLIVKESTGEAPCSSEAAQTVLTLMLDLEWDTVTMPDRTALLSKFSNYMDIPVADFKVSPVTGSSPSALLDSSALIAGPGNAKQVKNQGIKLSSVVGCDGNLDGKHNKDLATFVEEAAKDGSMARFTGVDVVGWHLTSSKPVPQPRLRREINFLNTREPSPVEPTMVAQPGVAVQATPFLSATIMPGMVQASADIHATGMYPIRPTATLDYQVTPTGVVEDGATSPLLIVPPPITPPPKPTRRPVNLSGLPPTEGQQIGGGKPLIAIAGELFKYQIPRDAFNDPDTPSPTVSVREQADKNRNWLEVVKQDSSNVLTGIPMPESKGVQEYQLEVSDGTSVLHIPFHIDVQVSDDAKYTHEMDVTLDEPYNDFQNSRRILFVDTLRTYYKDNSADHILIRSIKSGSTHVSWLNETLTNKDCMDPAIAQVTDKVVVSGQVNPEFQKHFQNAGFKVDKASVNKIGKCGPGASAEKTTGNDIYISTVVPAVVVSSLLLLACCIAIILYQKRKRDQERKRKSVPEPGIFKVNKPIILPGENFENHSKGNNGAGKKPTILEEERGGTMPPAYTNRGARGPNPDAEDRQDLPLLSIRPISPTQTHVRDAPHQPSSKLTLLPPSRQEP